MIKSNINGQIGDALKAHDDLRLTTLRGLSSALNYEFINKQHELSSDEEIIVVRREIKKRKDTVETYKALLEKDPVHVQEKIDKELAEVKILEEYLPPEMDAAELLKIIEDAIKELGASSVKDMGKVIGIVKARTGGNVDGSKLAELVKTKLQ